MRPAAVIRVASSLLGIVAVAAVGLILVAGAVSPDARWREGMASLFVTVAEPAADPWLLALAGAGLAVLALVVVGAQFSPPPKGTRLMFSVHQTEAGSTQLAGRAAIAAASARLAGVDGLVDVDASLATAAITLTLRVDDECDLAAVETEARQRLDHGFWIDLGLADLAVNLHIIHHPSPPRVR